MKAALYYFRRDRSLGWRTLAWNALGVALGVAALTTLELFSDRIGNTIGRDTKSFLAADFQVQSWRVYTPEVWRAVEELVGKDYLRQTDWVSSLQIPGDEVVTVSARALEGPYPYYGRFLTKPEVAIESLRAEPSILLDRSLEARGLKLGDRVRLGEIEFTVRGFILDEPQTVASAFALGPRVIVHQEWAEKTGMIGATSRAFRMILLRSDRDPREFAREFREKLPEPHWRLLTPDRANAQAQRVVDRISGFLALVALTAVFLGGAGVFMVFRGRYLLTLPQILTLRCLGLRARELVAVGTLQAAILSVLGWAVGSGVGIALEAWISKTAQERLQVGLSTPTLGPSLALAFVVTLIVVAVAVVLPLRQVLRTKVSEAFRDVESHRIGFAKSDLVAIALAAVVVCALVGRNEQVTALFLGGLAVVVATLAGAARLLVGLAARFRPEGPLSLRHALLGLERQRGAVLTLIVVLGLASFLPATVFLLSRTLRGQLDLTERQGLPNLFVLGVAPEDRDRLATKVEGMEFAPITQVRLKEVKGVPIENLSPSSSSVGDEGAEPSEREGQQVGEVSFTREFFSTRRTRLSESERLTAGSRLFGEPVEGRLRVSLEAGFAERLEVRPGDEIVVEMAGVTLPAVVQSFRKVDWFNFRPNFVMVFHEDDVEGAPFELVGIGSVAPAEVARLQREILREIPGASVLDGQSIADRLKSLLNQLATAVFSLGSFAVGSALLVFVGILLSRRSQRLKEVSLWRCLGLSRRSLSGLLGIELFVTSVLAGSLALGFSWVMSQVFARFGLDIPASSAGLGSAAAALLVGLPLALTGLGLWLLQPLIRVPTAELFQKES